MAAPTVFLALLASVVLLQDASPPESDPYPVDQLAGQVEALRGGPPGPLGVALQELTYAYVFHGDHARALETGREALELLAHAGDSANLALTHNQLGLAHWNLVRYDSAVAQLGRARELWAALDDRASLGRVYNNLGAAHYQWGNYELALTSFLRAVEYRRETGEEAGEALALTNVGLTFQDWGQFERAREAYERAVEISDRVEYSFGRAYSRLNLALLHLEEARYAEAAELFRTSLELYGVEAESIPPSDAVGGSILNTLGLGRALLLQGDHDAGLRLLEEALVTARDADNPQHEARAHLELGRAHQTLGQLDLAFEHLDVGLRTARERDQRPIALDLLAALAEVEDARGRSAEALDHLQAHVALRDSIFDQGALQRLTAMEAEAEIERRERENAELRAEQAVQDAVLARQRLATLLAGTLLASALVVVGMLVHFNRRGRVRERALADTNRSLEKTNRELLEARTEVQALKGLIPICSHCKRIRDDEGYWESVETYISERSEALFSHSICTDCGPKHYGSEWNEGG